VEHWVFGYANGTGAVTKQRHFLDTKAKIPKCGDHPKELGIAASRRQHIRLLWLIGLRWIACSKTKKPKKTQKTDKFQKSISDLNGNLQNQHPNSPTKTEKKKLNTKG